MAATPTPDANPASPGPALADAFELALDGTATAGEIDWIVANLPQRAGPLLDVNCGVGRALVPLVERGVTVHGIDPSAAALALCRARLGNSADATPLLRQAATDLNLPFRYAAACFDSNRFQRIADQTQAFAALVRIAAHLVPPGILLLDLVIPAEALHAPGAALVEVRTVTTADGATLVDRSETSVDVDGRRIGRRSRYEKRMGNAIVAREDERTACTWYTQDDIVKLVRESGFEAVEIVPSPRPGSGGEERFALTARLVAPTAPP